MARAEADLGTGSGGRLGLRQIIVIAAVVLAALAAVVSASLIVLTRNMHDASTALRETIQDVRVAREAEVDLLLHERATDPRIRAEIASRLHRDLTYEIRPVARELYERANAQVERYLATSGDPNVEPATRAAEFEAALRTLDQVVAAHIRDADRVIATSRRLDDLGDAIGLTAAVLLIVIPAALALWIRSSVVRPMLVLSKTMDRFGRGDLSVRATPAGAEELRRMTEQFNAIADALARQHKARLTHLAAVAHDLRNPLAALQMSSALVDPDLPLPSERQIRHGFSVFRRQITLLSRMVQDLLDATRVEAGHLALELEDTDLRVVVRDVVQLFKDTTEVHELSLELPEEPLLVRCDPLRVEQTLTNLVSNAIKYSPRGGCVRVVARRCRNMAEVAVSDEGIGIGESELEQIWEPFRRMGLSAESVPGVGLGLWTAKRLAEAHHGTITVQSTLGRGSTFTLSLPLVVHAPRAHRAAADDVSAKAEGAIPALGEARS